MSRLSKAHILQQLERGLIASCQPVDNGPMDSPTIVAAMAQAAVLGGAVGLRIEGIDNLRAVRSVVNLPIIGIVKRDLADSPIRITPYLQDIDDLAQAGADIIAFDGTDRVRPVAIAECVSQIKSLGLMTMADCATLEEGLYCQSLGVDLIGSTLSGYTGGEIPEYPDFALVTALAEQGCRVMAEGRYNTPELAAKAIQKGAFAVTVGSALTRLEHIVSWFSQAISQSKIGA